MSTADRTSKAADRSDEELVQQVAGGASEALTALYTRYAPLVFHIACQSLDTASAEEIVQDVFLTIWQKPDAYDRQRGAFRPWMLQIAHYRILNELRSVSLGTTRVDAAGNAMLVAEGSTFRAMPQAVQVTVEPVKGSDQPTGPIVINWPERSTNP